VQLADWILPLLLLTADDPHGRTASDLTLTPPPPPDPARRAAETVIGTRTDNGDSPPFRSESCPKRGQPPF